MTNRRMLPTAALAGGLLIAALAVPAPASAHCDSMDGPVVASARAALAAGDVDLVLHWVLPDDEAEIRDAFQRTLKVRAAGGDALQLADMWFFETLVRVHRAGEGAPYTGLKPAGWEAPALIIAADQALATGQIDGLATRVADHIARELRERYQQARALADFAPADVEAGRRYVAAYVEYTHFLEELHHLLHGTGHDHGDEGAGHTH